MVESEPLVRGLCPSVFGAWHRRQRGDSPFFVLCHLLVKNVPGSFVFDLFVWLHLFVWCSRRPLFSSLPDLSMLQRQRHQTGHVAAPYIVRGILDRGGLCRCTESIVSRRVWSRHDKQQTNDVVGVH